jgi:hypothetical protein
MAAEEIKTFADIIKRVREELSVPPNDANAITKIKAAINRIYINQVVPRARWYWLKKTTDVVHPKAVTAGTAAVTEDSAAVTLSSAPAAGLGSLVNYKIKATGYNEEYTISSHAAGGTAITISGAYQGDTNAAASYTIWNPKINLPADARETIDVWHDHHDVPMEGKGEQELRQIKLNNANREGFPIYYNTDDFFDPTSGTAETESDRYRQVEIFPARNDEDITVHVSYIQDVTGLDADTDEPLMPINDREVLVNGALSITLKAINSMPEEAQLAKGDFAEQLNAMAARVEDSFDTPSIAPNSRYTKAQRRSTRRNRFRDF